MYPGLLISRTQTLKTFCMWSSNGNFYGKIILFIMSVNKYYIHSNSVKFYCFCIDYFCNAESCKWYDYIYKKKERGAFVHKMIFEK
jgi:hypothetical protein